MSYLPNYLTTWIGCANVENQPNFGVVVVTSCLYSCFDVNSQKKKTAPIQVENWDFNLCASKWSIANSFSLKRSNLYQSFSLNRWFNLWMFPVDSPRFMNNKLHLTATIYASWCLCRQSFGLQPKSSRKRAKLQQLCQY